VNASSVADEAWRSRRWLWVTGADENGVQGGLNIARHQLIDVSIVMLISCTGIDMDILPLAGSTIRRERANRSLTWWSSMVRSGLSRKSHNNPIQTLSCNSRSGNHHPSIVYQSDVDYCLPCYIFLRDQVSSRGGRVKPSQMSLQIGP